MKSGFTLVEVIVVIAIIGAVSVLIGSNFFGLIGSADEYEKENLYKYLNEAACVYVDSKESGLKEDSCYGSDDGCTISSENLYDDGYIDENAGLLKSYSEEEIKSYTIKVSWNNNEKKCCVDTFGENDVTGEGAC